MLAAIHIQWVAGVIFIILYSITILGLVLVIIAENRNPLKTIPWVIVLLLAPGIGLLFYFFFGQDNRKQRIISRRTYKRIMKRPQEGKLPQDACTVPEPYQPLVTLLNNNNQSSLLYGSDIKIYTNGTDKFKDLLKDIQGAMGFEMPQVVYKWLSGKSLPSLDNFVILSRLLNTSIEDIFVIDGDSFLSFLLRFVEKNGFFALKGV